MFEVPANETIALAEAEGLRCLLNQARTPALRTPNVSWTRLVFAKPNEAARNRRSWTPGQTAPI